MALGGLTPKQKLALVAKALLLTISQTAEIAYGLL